MIISDYIKNKSKSIFMSATIQPTYVTAFKKFLSLHEIVHRNKPHCLYLLLVVQY